MNQSSLSAAVEALALGEVIKAEVWRGHRGYYNIEPDENLEPVDLIVTTGRNYIAKRISVGDAVVSAMAHMAIGTVSTAPALADTGLTGEIDRKPFAVGSTTDGDNVWRAINTWGGAADSITSVAIVEAGIFNHASSGQGIMMQRVTFAAVTLANSDLIKITMETNVGSS